jgi:CubicO group peptidase (beta-lactamase class C family)
MRRAAVAFVSLLFAVGQGLLPIRVSAQVVAQVVPERVGLSAAALGRVGALLDQFVTERKIGGAVVAVARRGQVAYLHAAGFQNIQSQTRMTERSLFRIYSMTKPVTAVAAMMLWEEGRFELDDPVARYLPAFSRVQVAPPQGQQAARPPARDITIRDLMLHTSGLSHRTSPLYTQLRVRRRDIPMSRFIDNIAAAPLMEDPGTQFRYSEATTVLGALIEVWSGKPLDEFLEQRIFRPLGMNDTGFWVTAEDRARLANVYRLSDGALTPFEIEEVPFTVKPALLEGAVGLVSTVPDYLRFAQMLLNGGQLRGVRILRPETVRMMTENGLTQEQLDRRPGTMGWGLANVNVVMQPASLEYPASMGEYGWDGTAGTIFWVDPELELLIVLMTQSAPADPDGLRLRVKSLVSEAVIR